MLNMSISKSQKHSFATKYWFQTCIKIFRSQLNKKETVQKRENFQEEKEEVKWVNEF